MNTETFLLRTLFATCVLACGLTLAAMIIAKPAPSGWTTAHTVATSTTAAGKAAQSAHASRTAG